MTGPAFREVQGAGISGIRDGSCRRGTCAPRKISAELIVGIDEVGRGPWPVPVVACAAVLNDPQRTHGLNDSKKLTRAKREAMFDAVRKTYLCYAIASASPAEIDEMNIPLRISWRCAARFRRSGSRASKSRSRNFPWN